ncbi:hypothetical protein CAPI_06125 [Corynebacterium capitovis DSM 44611]|uniref:DUF3515 domain-containing protein n=1 Tax=Corynebacterium capitovis TaxID=131081 RepID=UPI00036E2D28|nr:DUF3515 domain-containing protein [Corynebacterium capitovis]WKD57769.1 hypothetical protein CAPI_06125 [Corynebacterium capitovis DSM 44611]
MSVASENQFSPRVIAVSLGLALALVVGVLVGAKVVYERVARQPVALADISSPLADSSECTQLIDALPRNLGGRRRAELAQPAPAGAAAWQTSSLDRVTLRCGVDLPAQYTTYTPTEVEGGARWMRVDDLTPGSTMSTWYTVDRLPAVAVTSLGPAGDDPVAELDLSALPQQDAQPAPAPLSDLAAGTDSTCRSLLDALPAEVAQGYERVDADQHDTALWVHAGREPIVVRCGVANPPAYAAGAQIYQINGIAWFEDTQVANGTTSSTWYALGRKDVVAAYLPSEEGNAAVTALSDAIAASVPERS